MPPYQDSMRGSYMCIREYLTRRSRVELTRDELSIGDTAAHNYWPHHRTSAAHYRLQLLEIYLHRNTGKRQSSVINGCRDRVHFPVVIIENHPRVLPWLARPEGAPAITIPTRHRYRPSRSSISSLP